ncbi:MAG: hypothetical protein SYC29_06860 [Planctomycetota bacterium]|nr:hypothetical protein [Planctomycetota bacterium]
MRRVREKMTPSRAGRGRPAWRRPALPLLLLGMLLSLPTSPAAGSGEETDTFDPRAMGLEPKPLIVESLGLEMYYPLGATFQIHRTTRRTTVTLVDGAAVPAWSMRIQPMISSLPDPTAKGQIEQLLATWRAAGREFSVLANEPAHYDHRAGQLCYIRQRSEGEEEIIVGWLILPFGEREFLVFAIQTLPDGFDHVRPRLERSFSTLRLRDVKEIVDVRKIRLEAGRAFLEGVDEADLRDLIRPGRWLRYYIPAASAESGRDTERGCMYIEFIEAKRGAVNPDRAEDAYDPEDHQLGLMARVRGQIIDTEANATIDSRAFYWMAWDQSEERWSIQVTTRAGSRSRSEAQTGVRMPRSPGNPAGRIVIIDSSSGGATRDQKNWAAPQVYLSQALRWGLGRLLPRRPQEPRAFSYYFYDGTEESISLRVDRWEPAGDGSENWILTSRSKSDAPAIVSVYDEDGDLVRRTLPDGSVSEPIDLDELNRLWRSKGLRTEGLNR